MVLLYVLTNSNLQFCRLTVCLAHNTLELLKQCPGFRNPSLSTFRIWQWINRSHRAGSSIDYHLLSWAWQQAWLTEGYGDICDFRVWMTSYKVCVNHNLYCIPLVHFGFVRAQVDTLGRYRAEDGVSTMQALILRNNQSIGRSDYQLLSKFGVLWYIEKLTSVISINQRMCVPYTHFCDWIRASQTQWWSE